MEGQAENVIFHSKCFVPSACSVAFQLGNGLGVLLLDKGDWGIYRRGGGGGERKAYKHSKKGKPHNQAWI